MSGKAAKVIVTEKQHAILEQIANARTASQQLLQRAKIILLAFGGMLNMQICDLNDFHGHNFTNQNIL